jgi:uncharacterized protein YjdB
MLYQLQATISGGSSVVAGSTTGLTASVAGGSWSSSSTGVAAVNASGVVTGIAAGSATISYTVSNSCGSAVATKAISVTPASTGGGWWWYSGDRKNTNGR